MNKIEVIDMILKKLKDKKKYFSDNLNSTHINDEAKQDFINGQISGMLDAIDILLDCRMEAQTELSRV